MSKLSLVALFISASVGALWLPPRPITLPDPGRGSFFWDRSVAFAELERKFLERSESGCETESSAAALGNLAALVADLAADEPDPADTRWDLLEREIFDAAVVAAACRREAQGFARAMPKIQELLRRQAAHWDLRDPSVLARLYRLRYGLRAAFEEVLLQTKTEDLVLTHGDESLLEVPRIKVRGVVIQSGDILVSRGGAPTSALIARGNDRPGNFSHVALVHVSEDEKAFVIESHIESGVGIFSAEQYLEDKKLRIMVLRLHAGHPALKSTADLPHRAAQHALQRAHSNPPGYDFKMDYQDSSRMFCSEVVYDAYQSQGIGLWKALSSLSGPAAGKWLAGLGVEHFETLAPSDLEYDPQLRVVAEWRDPETLFDDHVDNAIVDALLGQAKAGLDLEYDPTKLGLARLAKGYSVLLHVFGKQGPVPDGMRSDAALRVERLRQLHANLDAKVRADAKRFQKEHRYVAPYWELVSMAKRHAAMLAPL